MSLKLSLGVLCVAACGAFAPPGAQAGVGFVQPPDMLAGTDYLSMHRAFGPVVADDFTVDEPQLLGVRWWGSYFADAGQSRGTTRQVQFEMSRHVDCPAGTPISPFCPGDPRSTAGAPQPYAYSTPGQPYRFQLVSATEAYLGITASGEDVYEYLVMFDNPWSTTPGAIEWIDIAWAAGQFSTDFEGSVWGWHESDQHHYDHAVQTDSAANRQLPLGSNPHLGPWDMLPERDMAFRMIVVPEPGALAMVSLALVGVMSLRRRTHDGTAARADRAARRERLEMRSARP